MDVSEHPHRLPAGALGPGLGLLLASLLSVSGCAQPLTLGGAAIGSTEQEILIRIVGEGLAPELTAFQSPRVRAVVQSAQIEGDGSAAAGVYFVYRLDPATTYTVAVHGRPLSGQTRMRTRVGTADRVYLFAPRAGFVDFTVSDVASVELLFFSDEEFAYRIDRITVQECLPCAQRATRRAVLSWGYVLQMLLVSTALGIFTLLLPRALPVPRLARFLVGFTLAPFAIGAWVIIVGMIVPGATRWWFLAPPLVASITLIGSRGRRAWRALAEAHRRDRARAALPWLGYTCYLGAAVVLVLLVQVMVANSNATVIAGDALVYFGEAMRFASEPGRSTMAGIEGAADGSFRGDYHGFFLPAFLAHGLMSLDSEPLAFPGPLAVGAPFQLTLAYMLLAAAACAALVRQIGAGALAVVLIPLAAPMQHISYALGRDAYRTIPLLLLILVLASVARRRSVPRHVLLPVMVLAAAAQVAHTLGGPIVAAIVAAWCLTRLVQRCGLGVPVVAVAVLGLLMGGLRYADAYVDTGRLLGEIDSGFGPDKPWDWVPPDRLAPPTVEIPATAEPTAAAVTSSAPMGTPLESEPRDRPGMGATPAGFLSRMAQNVGWFLSLDSYKLSGLGLIAAITGIIGWGRSRGIARDSPVLFISLVVFFGFVPFTGVFDWIAFDPLSTTLLTNYRYMLHWYAFAALNCVVVAFAAYEAFARRTSTRRLLAGSILGLFALIVTAGAARVVAVDWRAAGLRHDAWFDESIRPLQRVVEQLEPGERILLEDQAYAYYLGPKALVLFTRPMWPLQGAQTVEEARAALERMNVRAVVLREARMDTWNRLPFGYVLRTTAEQPEWARTVQFRVFLLGDTPSDSDG